MSQRLPVLTPTKVIRALQKAGFYIHRQTGSHIQLKHNDKPELRITVPYHSHDLPVTILHSIIKQAGLTVEEFRALL
jgi:predicted RNA binding protein YcfA (HicA-like mRNA interferase family)